MEFIEKAKLRCIHFIQVERFQQFILPQPYP